MKKSDINFSVELDETKMPVNISWSASDAGEIDNNCKAMMLSMWDRKEENTMRIDLWTKDMKVDEMRLFFHQTFVSMINTLERATGTDTTIQEMREYSKHLAEQMELIK
jgi:gliding motility-associated protein GldC